MNKIVIISGHEVVKKLFLLYATFPSSAVVEHLLIVVKTDWREGDRVRKGEGREVRRRKRDGREGEKGNLLHSS